MNRSFLAKLFGWGTAVVSAAGTLANNGFHLGHFHGTDFLTLIATFGAALGIHHASNTDGGK